MLAADYTACQDHHNQGFEITQWTLWQGH